MKACVIQPPYSRDFSLLDTYFTWYLDALDQCDDSMDLIVLPEFSNLPCEAVSRAQLLESCEKNSDILLRKASETAKRCGATLFVNMAYPVAEGLRNTTVAFRRDGTQAGCYFKQHLTPGEITTLKLDCDYTYEFSEPTVLTIDGVRYGFITCYDTYFYEAFSNIARQNVDIIISCSYMRSDPHHVLSLLNCFCAYNCNAYMVRSSVSMGEDSPVGGCSMIVSPDGRVLLNMENRTGLGCAEIDPQAKYYKPAGFGNPPAAHYAYVEKGRRPWKYRPGGSAIVCSDETMSYPRVCAWNGMQEGLTPGTMAAFGAAVALDAQELGFSLTLCNGCLMAGQVPLDVLLKKFSCHAVMHMDIDTLEITPQLLQTLTQLLHRYDCETYAYLVCSNLSVLQQIHREYPQLRLCLAADSADALSLAVDAGCQKIQLPQVRPQQLEQIHAAGLRCNVMGGEIGDTFITNCFSP